MELTLDKLIETYGDHNHEFSSLKKVCDSEKAQIKDLMSAAGLREKTVGNWKVSYIVSERETLDEEKLLKILIKDWTSRYDDTTPCPYIKTKQYIDMDILESVLYAGEIPNDVLLKMDECRNVTEVITLKCTKAKKKVEEE